MKKQIIDLSNLVTLAEAARQKGLARQRIWALVQAGRLVCYTIGGVPFVDIREVMTLEGKRGRPKKQPVE